MARNYNIELYRCLCMMGIVCIHSFSWCGVVSHRCWALSSPALIGFVMISGWFGMHFKTIKLIRLLGVVVTCVLICKFMGLAKDRTLYGKEYWYVWAYAFVLLLSPIVDAFVEQCADRKKLTEVFVLIGTLLWGWIFLAQIVPRHIPTVSGFGACSGVVLLCVYILTRLIRQLGAADWLLGRKTLLMAIFVASLIAVCLGLRHDAGIFAFAYAFSILLLVIGLPLPERIGKLFAFISPSLFCVYLFHMTLSRFFPAWESEIRRVTHLPHAASQFALGILVFMGCIAMDMPRRFVVFVYKKWNASRKVKV